MRAREASHPGHRRSRRLHPDHLRRWRGNSGKHHRAAGPVRERRASCDRARLVPIVQPDSSGFPGPAHGEHRNRPQHDRGQQPDRRAAEAVAVGGQRTAEPAGPAAADERGARGESPAAGAAKRGDRPPQERGRVGQDPCGAEGRAARDHLALQVGVPCQHVARAPHAAQQPSDLGTGAGGQPGWEPAAKADRVRDDHPRFGNRPPKAHQRHPRPVEDRVRHHCAGNLELAPGAAETDAGANVPACRRRHQCLFHDRRAARAAGDHPHRPAAATAGPQQPAEQRVQVHGEGEGRVRGSASHLGLESRQRGSQSGHRRGRLQGHRHRHWHPAGEAAIDLRSVRAARRDHQPQVRRHGPWAVHLPRADPPARRRDPPRQRAGGRQCVHRLPPRFVARAFGPDFTFADGQRLVGRSGGGCQPGGRSRRGRQPYVAGPGISAGGRSTSGRGHQEPARPRGRPCASAVHRRSHEAGQRGHDGRRDGRRGAGVPGEGSLRLRRARPGTAGEQRLEGDRGARGQQGDGLDAAARLHGSRTYSQGGGQAQQGRQEHRDQGR